MSKQPLIQTSKLRLVAFDETGNTGQNLLDPTQPVFALASVCIEDERARSLVSAAQPNSAAEAKFAILRTSKAGRKRVLSLLLDGALTRDEVRIALYHKSFMVTTKIVDALVETWHYRMGIDLYENAAHLGLANLLHSVVPALCGIDAFRDWQVRFVAMVRDKTPATVDAFYQQTKVLRKLNSDPEFDIFLAMIEFTRSIVDEGVHAGDKVALDPAIPALVQLAAQWTAALGEPFDPVHDRSKPISFALEELRLLLSVDEIPKVFQNMGLTSAFPIQAPDIRFADSSDLPQLQVADIFAGATATLMRARARGEHDPFAEDLFRYGIANFVSNPVWPDTAVTPDELEAYERPGSKELDYIVALATRRAMRLEENDPDK